VAAVFTEVTAGKGQFVLVSGEAGIGKTSLVERFAETHQEQARLLWGACDALFTPRSLGPLYDIAPKAQSNLLTLLEDGLSIRWFSAQSASPNRRRMSNALCLPSIGPRLSLG